MRPPVPGGGRQFGRDRRIRKSDEFAAILKSGSRGSSAYLTVALVPAKGTGRIGISASTRVGGAVERNRARRVIREHYRRAPKNSFLPYDLVVNVKPGFTDLSADQAARAIEEAITRAIASRNRAGRPSGPRS